MIHPRTHQSVLLGRVVLRTLRTTAIFAPKTEAALLRGSCIVTANHVSLLDGLLIAAAVPPLVCAVDTEYSRDSKASKLGLSSLERLGFGRVVPLDSATPYGIRTLARVLADGHNVLLFPEGAISVTGRPGNARPGLRWLLNQTSATHVPLHLSGAEDSRLFAKTGRRWWPLIRITG
jgi:1-acyl-sn-glycerol-3-phosphate acyltransferase